MNRNGYTLAGIPRRKRHRGLKIFLAIVAVLLVAGGIAFALHYNTVMLFAGKGTVSVPNASSLAQALRSNPEYENVQTSTDASGDTIVTARSKDGAVDVKSTTKPSGEQKIEVQMDVKKMDGVSTSKSLGNLQAMQKQVSQYLVSAVSPSQLSGVESYVAREMFAQYQSGNQTFSVSHDFDGTQLHATGDFSTGLVHLDVERAAGAQK